MSNEFIARKGLISLDTIVGASGSKCGSAAAHVHQMTGSLNISGSSTITGNVAISGSTIMSGGMSVAGGIDPNIFGDSLTDQHIFTGSVLINGQVNVNSGVDPNVFGDNINDIHIFTGSVLINGRVSGSSMTGSLFGTASAAISSSIATTASLANAVAFTNITGRPTLVSASSQIIYAQISNIPAGIVGSSAQVTTLLPTGTVSS